MATLSGHIETIGIGDLLRVPITSKRTGVLIVIGESGEGRLYYADGRLISASLGTAKGAQVIADVMTWQTGEFEFREGETTPDLTAEEGIHDVLMHEVKAWYASRLSGAKVASGAGRPHLTAIPGSGGKPDNLVKLDNRAGAGSTAAKGSAKLDLRGKTIDKNGDFGSRDAALAGISYEVAGELSALLNYGAVKYLEMRPGADDCLAIEVRGENLVAAVLPADCETEEELAKIR